jgi:hypothetical protein
MAVPAVLTNKLGPLPVWAWIGVGGVGGGLALRWYRSRHAASAGASAASAPGVTDSQTADAGGYTPDASGYYADTGSTGGSVSGGGGSGGGAVGGSDLGTVLPDTGFGTPASPSSPAPPPDGYAYDQNGQLQPKDIVQAGMIFGILDDLAAGGYTVANGQVVPITPSTPVSPTAATVPPTAPYHFGGAAPDPIATTPPPPPPPALTPSPAMAAPTTSPTAHTTPTSGTLLWKGTATPNLQTIATRYGIPLTSLRVTTSGPATGSVNVVTVK